MQDETMKAFKSTVTPVNTLTSLHVPSGLANFDTTPKPMLLHVKPYTPCNEPAFVHQGCINTPSHNTPPATGNGSPNPPRLPLPAYRAYFEEIRRDDWAALEARLAGASESGEARGALLHGTFQVGTNAN